jgi:hypothetical protein
VTHVLIPLALITTLFGAMFALIAAGRRLGAGRKGDGLAAIDGAVFGLMGLLIAFTFGSAAVRFETRRNLIVEEANDIGTAYLRLDLLPADAQPPLREAFRRYVDVRLEVYRKITDLDATKAELARMAELQQQIWAGSVAGCRQVDSPAACMLLLAALNDMIDITTTRTVAFQTHQPAVVFLMLALVMLACSLLAGFGMGAGEGRGSRIHAICFAVVLALAFYVILDLEYPRIGLIRVDWMDRVLEDVRHGMR